MKHLLFFLFCFSGMLRAQQDSVVFDAGSVLPDRIYLTYSDFRAGGGISREEVEWNGDKTQLEFLTRILSAETFSCKINGAVAKIDTINVWGYSQNNWLYLNYKGEFYRVPVFGAISYMVANVTVNVPGYYDPRFGYTTGSGSATEVREFLMSFYDGRIRELSVKEALELFKPDAALYEEFKKLRKGSQKNELYRYIRKYNAAHPVYFRVTR